jgi:hypothetical protein
VRRPWIAAAGIAASAAVVALVVGTGLGWWSGGSSASVPQGGLAVRTSLGPSPTFFGDVLRAEIDVSAASQATRISVVPAFTPYAPIEAPAVSRTRNGSLASVHYRYLIQCLSVDCLPVDAPSRLRLKPVVVTAVENGRPLRAAAQWPETFVASRLSSRDLAQPRFRRSAALPSPDYWASPHLLADLLTAVAGALAAVAAGLAGRELVRSFARRRRPVELTPLEAALLYTRESARRPAADRRKALALLAQTLDAEGVPALADTAGGAAWSDSPPTAETALRLADEVETVRDGGR